MGEGRGGWLLPSPVPTRRDDGGVGGTRRGGDGTGRREGGSSHRGLSRGSYFVSEASGVESETNILGVDTVGP